MRRETQMNRWSAVALDHVPFSGELIALEVAWVLEGFIEISAEQTGDVRVSEDQNVVRLDIQPPKTVVGRAGEYLEWHALAASDEHLVVLELLEMCSFDVVLSRRRHQPLGRG